MHFKKLLDGSYIHKWDGQEVSKKRVKEKDEIKGMNGGKFPQGHVIEEMQIEEPFCIEHPYEVVQIFHHEWNMPTEKTFSTKSNFSKMSLSLAIELIAPYSSHRLISIRQISHLKLALGTQMEKQAMISDCYFYFIEDHMDQYQLAFRTQRDQYQAVFIAQLQIQQEEMMTYLYSIFPLSPPPILSLIYSIFPHDFNVAKWERYKLFIGLSTGFKSYFKVILDIYLVWKCFNTPLMLVALLWICFQTCFIPLWIAPLPVYLDFLDIMDITLDFMVIYFQYTSCYSYHLLHILRDIDLFGLMIVRWMIVHLCIFFLIFYLLVSLSFIFLICFIHLSNESLFSGQHSFVIIKKGRLLA